MKTLKTLFILLLLTMLMTSCIDHTEDLELQDRLKTETVNSKLYNTISLDTGDGSENDGLDRE